MQTYLVIIYDINGLDLFVLLHFPAAIGNLIDT